MKLDKVVNEARRRCPSSSMPGTVPKARPRFRRKDLSRSGKRRNDIIYHARRLVALGLLTAEQADLAMQRFLASQEDRGSQQRPRRHRRNGSSAHAVSESQVGPCQRLTFQTQAYSKIPEAMSADPKVGAGYSQVY